MLWGAISRAVRVPTRLERDIDLDVTDPTADPVLRLVGNKNFLSEELVACEAGYRWQASSKLGMDFNVYHNVYRGLAAAERATPFIGADGHIIVPAIIRNLSDGRPMERPLVGVVVYQCMRRLIGVVRSRGRWAQERGIVVALRMSLSADLPQVIGGRERGS